MKILSLLLALAILLGALPVHASESAPWAWSASLPEAFGPSGPPTQRTSAAMKQFIREPRGPRSPTVAEVLAAFGAPEGFSPHFLGTRTRRGSKATGGPGTLRFVLDGGRAEAHIFVSGPGGGVVLAHRYGPGRSMDLLYK